MCKFGCTYRMAIVNNPKGRSKSKTRLSPSIIVRVCVSFLLLSAPPAWDRSYASNSFTDRDPTRSRFLPSPRAPAAPHAAACGTYTTNKTKRIFTHSLLVLPPPASSCTHPHPFQLAPRAAVQAHPFRSLTAATRGGRGACAAPQLRPAARFRRSGSG